MNKYKYYLDEMRSKLPLEESFDIVERPISIGGREGTMFFVDGLVKGDVMQLLMSYLMAIGTESMKSIRTADDFLKNNLPYLDSPVENKVDKAVKQFYTGMIPILIDGLDKIILLDIRSYPMRSVEEPSKEKTLRGAKDGFTETMMTNIALIRRRIRDDRLIFKNHVIGKSTKTDIALVYMKGISDSHQVEKMNKRLERLDIDSVDVGEQTVVEALSRQKYGSGRTSRLNPFPKVRYTQRPDIVAAHLTEGKMAVIVDNTPTVILMPTGIFDFIQDADDYYFPALTGNYFRSLRLLNILVILFLTPSYLLIAQGYIKAPGTIEFFIPHEAFAIPLFWQFILLELAVDGLKLASLNTPESLGMSLSVIGALLLGEFSVSSGWFIPQTILCAAVVALASFTQPSIELGYGIKFIRILMLIGVYLLGLWGLAAAVVIGFSVMAFTKTITGHSYLYPLIPFDGNALKHLIFRTGRGKESRRG